MSGRLTNEEIARRFQLPERKSKLKSLLKQDREEYCLCRSSDTTRFMIACDACEDWFHGDCIGISEKEAKSIKLYYCQECRSEDPTLKIIYKPLKKFPEEKNQNFQPKKRSYDDTYIPPYDEYSPIKRGRPSLTARPVLKQSSSSSKLWKKNKRVPLRRGRQLIKGRRKEDYESDSDESEDYAESEPPTWHHSNIGSAYKDNMQCFGPRCVNVARKDSKYCSDECGKQLSTNRLLHILPHRVHDWTQTDSVAEMFAVQLVKEYTEKDRVAKRILAELDEKNKVLDRAIERAKQLEVDPDKTRQHVDEADITLYCVTCGHEIHVRTALKHMEKCFNKYEGQSTFGSLYKTKIEGNNMFCDFYSPSSRTYCKRLRVLCPEHYKDPKVGRNEICGCPLVKDVFTETGEICQIAKKDCTRHFAWEKLRQAEIDMERVRQWLKIDDIGEKLRHLNSRVCGRVGALPLLLNCTYDHQLKDEMTPKEDQELLKSLEDSLVSRYGRHRQDKYSVTKAHKNLLKTIRKNWLPMEDDENCT